MSELEGRIALVTGASRGIGAASALVLAERGARVAVNYREDKEGADRTAEAIRDLGAEAIAVRGDVSQQEDVEAVFQEVEAAFGPVDILVANAGKTQDRVLALQDEESWRSVLEVNLDGVQRTCKRALRPMLRGGWGRIVAVSSVAGLHGNIGQTNYCAAKAGVIGFVKALARETALRGVTANVVAPGYVDTAMFDLVGEERREVAVAQVPMARSGTAEEIAAAVSFLSSPGASYITGSVLVVDGGLSS